MHEDQETQYSTAEFLSPTRSPSKRRLCILGRKGSPTSTSTPKQAEKRLSFFSQKIAGNANLDEQEQKSRDLSALLSPRLEKQLTKNDRRRSFLPPLSGLRSPLRFSPKGSFRRTDTSGDDDDNSFDERERIGNDSDSDEEEVEKVATEDDMLLLLCRELELITGDSDDEYDNEDDEE